MFRLVLLCLAAIAPSLAAGLAQSVTIHRDTYGVPHIVGKSDAAVVFGLMYAQAEDNFWQLEQDYVRALGHAAEIEGPSGLQNDILVNAYETIARGKEQYQRATPRLRALCDAFAAGVNYYLETHPDVKPRLLTRWEPWFILANDLLRPAGAGISRAEREAAFPILAGITPAPTPEDDADAGSNMWAVSPKRSASGKALLMINPHVAFFGGGQRYEAHLRSNEGLDVSGFAILGTPYIRSGFNRNLGWSHTNNYARTADVYIEKFDDPAHPNAYRYGAGYREAAQWTAPIRVKTAAGIETRTVTFRKTHHGPILGIGPQMAFAVRTPTAVVMEQRIAMNKARNLREFQRALAMRALTGSNTLYADRAGNIYYLHGNAIPKRSTRIDWSKPIDGSDPETEWQGLHTLDELPHILNPKSGWLQNCNSTPFLTTEGPDNPVAANYPAYMAPEPDTPRSQRSRAILAGEHRFTFDEWAKLALDTKVGIAAAQIADLLKSYRALMQSDGPRAARLADAVEILVQWDQVSRNDSIAAAVFLSMAARANALRTSGSTDPHLQFTALEQGLANLQRSFGTWRVAWGEVNRLQRVHTSGTQEPFSDAKPSVQVPGAPTYTGTIFTFGTRAQQGQKRNYGITGNTYVAVVEFDKKPVARSLLVSGQSADHVSKHYFDQAPLYSSQQFKPAWFELPEIKQHLERIYQPGK